MVEPLGEGGASRRGWEDTWIALTGLRVALKKPSTIEGRGDRAVALQWLMGEPGRVRRGVAQGGAWGLGTAAPMAWGATG